MSDTHTHTLSLSPLWESEQEEFHYGGIYFEGQSSYLSCVRVCACLCVCVFVCLCVCVCVVSGLGGEVTALL